MDGREINSSSFLTLGKEYVVLALMININKNKRIVYIESDDNKPGFFDLRQFEIISNYIPSSWEVEYVPEIDKLYLMPRSWLKYNCFWDKFVDDEDPEAVKLYSLERDVIYKEEINKTSKGNLS